MITEGDEGVEGLMKPGLNMVLAWTFARRLGLVLEPRVIDGRFRLAMVEERDDG